jgi:2-amino-4-hydroxy-6-hydroxymethyldihydropteridine diphosphokinase
MPHCLISFGSNLGDRFQRIADAARAVATHPCVDSFQASRLFETPAIGGPSGQDPFLNGVALLQTDAAAREILDLLQKTETQLGRQRAVRWDSRSIDLDVVLYGDLQGSSRTLSVPNPRDTARWFVFDPPPEVAGAWRDPRFGWSIADQAKHLERGVPSLAMVGGARQLREELCQRLSDEFGVKTFRDPEAGIVLDEPVPWVSSFLPPLPNPSAIEAGHPNVPRLVAQLQWTTPESRWPATHQLWHSINDWPEYRLEVDSPDWTVKELASAIDSMGCPLYPVTENGDWW